MDLSATTTFSAINSTIAYSSYITSSTTQTIAATAVVWAVVTPTATANSQPLFSIISSTTAIPFATGGLPGCDFFKSVYTVPLPNPDIDGLGVVLAFLISAHLVWVFALILFFCTLIPKESCNSIDKNLLHSLSVLSDSSQLHKGNAPFRSFLQRVTQRSWYLNLQRRFRERRIYIFFDDSEGWRAVFEEAILTISDSQLVTGISILTALFANWSTTSMYHWYIATYLAWMSSQVHLTCITVMKKYFRDPERVFLRNFRVCCMLILGFMLAIALAPTGVTAWNQAFGYADALWPEQATLAWGQSVKANQSAIKGSGTPAHCFLRSDFSDVHVSVPAIFSYLFLVIGYTWKILALSSENVFLINQLEKGSTWLKARYGGLDSSQHDTKRRRFLLWLTWVYTTLINFTQSFWCSVIWLSVTLWWGTAVIIVIRRTAGSIVTNGGNEDSWSFGQVLPLVMLFLPVLTIIDKIYEKKYAGTARNTPAPSVIGGNNMPADFSVQHQHKRYFFTATSWLTTFLIVGLGVWGFYSILTYEFQTVWTFKRIEGGQVQHNVDTVAVSYTSRTTGGFTVGILAAAGGIALLLLLLLTLMLVFPMRKEKLQLLPSDVHTAEHSPPLQFEEEEPKTEQRDLRWPPQTHNQSSGTMSTIQSDASKETAKFVLPPLRLSGFYPEIDDIQYIRLLPSTTLEEM